MKQLFKHQINLLITLITVQTFFAACSRDDRPAASGGAELQISLSAQGFVSDSPETRASDLGYATTFASGDQIGITVVASDNATILHNNVPCTYSSENGAWTPGAAILEHAGATYFAYYPYSADNSANGGKLPDDIVGDFMPQADQRLYTDYKASDLMAGTGSVIGTTLNITLTHALALVEVSLPSGADVTKIQIGADDVTNMACPYEGVYRYLVKPPQTTETLSGAYSLGGQNFAWEKAGASLAAGNYTRVNVRFSPSYDPGVLINGVRWATRNVDAVGTFAAAPESPGKFYQWNRKVAWAATGTVSGWDTSTPGGTEWEAANDPSPAGWRVPTLAEILSLLDDSEVTRERTTQNSVNGYKFTDKTNTGNSIFLPAAGYLHYNGGTLRNAGMGGYYWSSSQRSDADSYNLDFNSDYAYWDSYYDRRDGFSVRCVQE